MSENDIDFNDTSIAFAGKTNWQLRKAKFIFETMKKPWMVTLGTRLTLEALKLHLPVKGLIRGTLFQQFCGWESIEKCRDTIDQLGKFNVQTILDYSVEGQETEESFDRTLQEALRVVEFAHGEKNIAFCVIKLTGLGSAVLMEKRQQRQNMSQEEEIQYEKFEKRAHQLAAAAAEKGLKFMIDAEESWIQDEIDRIAYDLMRIHNQSEPVVFNTYQLYRHQALPNMQKAFDRLRLEGVYFGAKIVRGAYMEKERERASKLNYSDPIQSTKEDTDKDYDKAIDFALDHLEQFSVCAGTHNERSSAYLASQVVARNIDKSDPRVFFAQLLGMSDNISFKLSKMGFNVAKYVPYGPVEKVLPYLFRRAEENTSISGQSGRELALLESEVIRRHSK